jgi:hypothetical protein
MWLLESAKDRILGVGTLEQQVLPRVQYGTACLLIRNTIGCVSCSDEWRMARCFRLVQEGHVGETLALQAGSMGEIVAKQEILL